MTELGTYLNRDIKVGNTINTDLDKKKNGSGSDSLISTKILFRLTSP